MIDKMKQLSEVVCIAEKATSPNKMRLEVIVTSQGIRLDGYWRGRTISKQFPWEVIDAWQDNFWPKICFDMLLEHADPKLDA